jgi:hypothetical protein
MTVSSVKGKAYDTVSVKYVKGGITKLCVNSQLSSFYWTKVVFVLICKFKIIIMKGELV